MSVLSDPAFKDTMALKFLDHTELLLKTIDTDYSLIRYSVQVFTSESTARGLILNPKTFNRALNLLEMFIARSAFEESSSDIDKATYDVLWNLSINFKYLLSKPLNAQIAVCETELIPKLASACARMWRYNSVEPRTSHVSVDAGSFKVRCYGVEEFMMEPIKPLLPYFSTISPERMREYWVTISAIMHQLPPGKNSVHVMLLRFLCHLLWRTDASNLLSVEDWIWLIRESSSTIGFIDSIAVKQWVLYGVTMLNNKVVYYQHSQFFYELDLGVL
jgi:hypothetical protein